VIPRKDKDKFNASEPVNDAQFLSYVVNPELAGLLHAIYGVDVPPAPRNDLVAVFLTGVAGLNQPPAVHPAELLRLNMSIAPSTHPNRFGVIAGDVAGFPNGRRLADDVTDIELRAVAGGTVLTPAFNRAPNNQLGDGVDFNDRPYLPFFPFEATPHQGFDHEHHREQHGRSGFGPHSDDDSADGPSSDAAGAAVSSGPSLGFAGPNPAARAELQYTLEKTTFVTLKIYDVQGRVVRSLLEQSAAPGTFRATWDGRDDSGRPAGKGVFFARMTADGRNVDSRKVVLD
jgi:uncharacterized protein DUF4331/flagellar hook capping protein FlgD